MKSGWFLCISLFVIGCGQRHSPAINAEALAQAHCGSCHAFPEPDLLDKNSWQEYVLPRMGFMLGFYADSSERVELFEAGEAGRKLRDSQLFPAQPKISPAHWEAIQTYFLSNAPTELSREKSIPILDRLPHFQFRVPDHFLSPPSSTLVQFTTEGDILIGDAQSGRMHYFDAHLSLRQTANTREGLVHVQEEADQWFMTVMGSFSPTDQAKGMLFSLPRTKEGKPEILIQALQRPVHAAYADFDEDGQSEIVICEFGKWTGRLGIWDNREPGNWTVKVLRDQAGATRTEIVDLDQDGDLDIVALFGQGDEGIFYFQNDGQGNFLEKRLLRFPPSWGSSYFTLLDWNQDGALDILYTCGDNADFKPILKPYHGIRLFLNDGQHQFSEHFFLPQNGAYKAIAQDFDQDGDLDIAAISFFPDFSTGAKEGFLYWRNDGQDTFTAHSFPQVELGRWISMDAADWDQDGDMDLVLGSLAFEVVPKSNHVEKWVKNGLAFLVLENQIR
ncbi:MAG: VCBS repeat-containing protein [Bacteroidota bacterium]